MSKTLTNLLVKRATDHAKQGFLHLLDYETGNLESITEAIIQAAAIPRAITKMGMNVDYAPGGKLTVASVQGMQNSLNNSVQKAGFVKSYGRDLDDYSRELWNYFEATCLAVEEVAQ